MEWIDESVAIGDWRDVARVRLLQKERIDLIMDARPLFTGPRSARRPLVDRVNRSADLLVDLSKKGVKVMVRCHHGRDRSPFVVMLYICRRSGLGLQEAYELVKSKRPRTVFHPEWVEAFSAPENGQTDHPMIKVPTEEPVSPV